MAIRLIALDLDNTLLDRTLRIPPRNAAAVRAARARGVHVLLASARPPRSMRRYQAELGLDGPVVACNGALVYNLAAGKPLRHTPIPTAAARAAVAYLRRADPSLNLSLECIDRWHVDRYDADLQRAVEDYGIDPPHGVGTIDEVLAAGAEPVTKILFGSTTLGESCVAALDAALGPRVTVVRSSDQLVEVMAAEASKAAALAWVARRLGVDAAEVLALGDSYNDIPMLRWAGLGVAMGNAPDTVKSAAVAVTRTHDEAGVAAAIERYVLGVAEAGEP